MSDPKHEHVLHFVPKHVRALALVLNQRLLFQVAVSTRALGALICVESATGE
jgi:hypothetical protein